MLSDVKKRPFVRMGGPRASPGIQSLETGIRIFNTLQGLGRHAPLLELATATHMHPAKLHRYLTSLIRTGLVEQDGLRRYGVTDGALRPHHGNPYLIQARELATLALPKLCKQIGETVFTTVWGRLGPTLVHIEEPSRSVTVRPATRGDLPLMTSATGRVYAAYMSQERLARLLEAELESRFPPGADSDRARALRSYHRQLAEVRRRGLARSLGERYPGLTSLSAPVFDQHGTVILAVTAFGLAPTFSGSWDGRAAKALLQCTAEITSRIGGTPSPHIR